MIPFPSESYRVLVRLQCSDGGPGPVGPVGAFEEKKGPSCLHMVLGRTMVDRSTSWTQLSTALSHLFSSHLQILCGASPTAREEAQRSLLGLSSASIASFSIGEETALFFITLSLFIHLLVLMIVSGEFSADTD